MRSRAPSGWPEQPLGCPEGPQRWQDLRALAQAVALVLPAHPMDPVDSSMQALPQELIDGSACGPCLLQEDRA